ncbi:hypothetical protein QYF61_004131 [Mycteria americana]|uniref:Uncharacterized protein n=1 Tax=Mycteria americana TaxID=33587 RepID=A0AAN7NVW8_MYCAM|nr:hypothetical protein QYF61_004131 [Mycteria americana]
MGSREDFATHCTLALLPGSQKGRGHLHERVKELALGQKAFHLWVTNSNPAQVNSGYKLSSSNESSEIRVGNRRSRALTLLSIFHALTDTNRRATTCKEGDLGLWVKLGGQEIGKPQPFQEMAFRIALPGACSGNQNGAACPSSSHCAEPPQNKLQEISDLNLSTCAAGRDMAAAVPKTIAEHRGHLPSSRRSGLLQMSHLDVRMVAGPIHSAWRIPPLPQSSPACLMERYSTSLSSPWGLHFSFLACPVDGNKKCEDFVLLRNDQQGFTKGKSCLTNLIAFYKEVNSFVDEGRAVDVVYLN